MAEKKAREYDEDSMEVNTALNMVTVNVKEYLKVNIGSEWFEFKRGVQKVRKEHKEILLARGVLLPL